MIDLPKFQLYGEGDTPDERALRPGVELRGWEELDEHDKLIILREIEAREVRRHDIRVLKTIQFLNVRYLHRLPGPQLHRVKDDDFSPDEDDYHNAARDDFRGILKHSPPNIVFAALSKFASLSIDEYSYETAAKEPDHIKAQQALEQAFRNFDRFAVVLNHSLSQFRVNKLLTREGFIPRQDEQIEQTIYVPTLNALSVPRWKLVSADLGDAFDKYSRGDYAETITQVHSAIQRFLQILLCREEGKNGKGELKNLFADAEDKGLLPKSAFIRHLRSYFQDERANNSTAKPSGKDTTAEEALLMLNMAMSFFQFCLSRTR